MILHRFYLLLVDMNMTIRESQIWGGQFVFIILSYRVSSIGSIFPLHKRLVISPIYELNLCKNHLPTSYPLHYFLGSKKKLTNAFHISDLMLFI